MKTKSQGILWKKIWVLGGMLFLPAVLFYFFLFNTTAHIHRLPFYGPHGYGEIREPGKRPRTDTLYYELPAWQLRGIDGKSIGSADLSGNIYVAHFLPFPVKDIPDEVVYMALDVLKNDSLVGFVSLGEEQAKSWSRPTDFSPQFAGLESRWRYSTDLDSSFGSADVHAYLFPSTGLPNPVPDPMCLVLVDKEGRIRGYYSPLLAKDAKRLKEDIAHLNREYAFHFRTHRFYKFDDKLERGPQKP
jgi:hypothetical protein